MAYHYYCSSSQTNKGCNEACVEKFYQTNCSSFCQKDTYNAYLNCPVNRPCFITLWDTIYLTHTNDLCENLPDSNAAIAVDCGAFDWFKIKIWIGHNHVPCNSLSSTINLAQCKCKHCYYCGHHVYCSCSANEYVETSLSPSTVTTRNISTSTDITSAAITSHQIGTSSSDVNTKVPHETSTISPTPAAVRDSVKSGVTGAAAGGAVGLLLLILLVLFALWFRKRRVKKSKDRHINTQPAVSNRMYDTHSDSFATPFEGTFTEPRDGTVLDKNAGGKQTEDCQIGKPQSEETYYNLDPNGVVMNMENAAYQGSSDNVYENSLGPPHLQSKQNGRTNIISEESDYNTLNKDRSDKILDQCDDQYQHVKNTPNSDGQEDYDELAKPFEKQKNYPIEDDYDHAKVLSRRHGDDEDDYDHLN